MNKIIFSLGCLITITILSPVFAEETIDIAAIYALTGVAAESNSFSLQGIHHAVNEINQRGGVLGKKLHLLVFDNQSTPIGSSVAAEEAAAANVAAIVGSDWSSHSLAVARVAQARKIPTISSYSTNPEITKIGNYIFRACFTDNFQGSVLARFARQEIKAATAVIFIDVTSDYSIGISGIFRENFERLGGKILQEIEYKLKKQPFDQQILQAKQSRVDVIFLAGHDESGLIAKQIQDAGISAVLLGGDGWSSPSFFSKGGMMLKQAYYSTHWSEFMDSERSRLFVQKYKHAGKFGVTTALGYDAVMVLADAIKRAGSTDRDKIRDAIAETRGFEGVTGTITFNIHGDPVKSVVIMEIKNGTPHYLETLAP
jgi:branched-chain amino acid transport system substrate-binding protein